jgi:DNA-binding LytR/AlgR family response regulator
MTELLNNYQSIKSSRGSISRLEDLVLVHATAGDQWSVQSFDSSIIDTNSLQQEEEELKKSIEVLQRQQTILTQVNERLVTEVEQGKNLRKSQAELLLQQEQ